MKPILFKNEDYAHVVLGVKTESGIRDARRAQQSETGHDWHLHLMIAHPQSFASSSWSFLLPGLLFTQMAALSCTHGVTSKLAIHEFDKRFHKGLPCPLTVFTAA